MKPEITIYTDGACRGNPGDGGWGALLIYETNEKSICGGERNTTNNRMELLAVIKALEMIKQTSEIKIYTDSTYVQKGITEWIHVWKRNHWKNSSKKIIKNKKTMYVISEKKYMAMIESFNERLVSNMLKNLTQIGLLESAYDSELNDFIFWIKEQDQPNENKDQSNKTN